MARQRGELPGDDQAYELAEPGPPPPGSSQPAPVSAEAPAVSPAPGQRRSRALLAGLTALLLILGMRVAFFNMWADGVLRNQDEAMMFGASMNPYTGGPVNWLVWPGGLQRYAAQAAVPIDYLVRLGPVASPQRFLEYLAGELRDEFHMARVLRGFTIAVSSLGLAALAIMLARQTGRAAWAVLWVVLAAAAPLVWERSVMGTADATSWGLACLAVAVATGLGAPRRLEPGWALAAALLAGAATGTKFTSLYLVPLALGGSIAFSTRRRHAVLVWLVAMPLGHVLVNPYLVTDPLRSAKAILGNLVTREAIGSPWEILLVGVPSWFILAGLAGLVVTLRRSGLRWAGYGTLGCIALGLATTLRTSRIDPHYLAPFVIAATVCGCLGLARLVGPRRWPGWALLAATVAAVGFGAWHVVRADRAIADRYSSAHATAALLDELVGAKLGLRVVVPASFGPFVYRNATGDSLREMARSMQQAVASDEVIGQYLGGFGLEPQTARAFADHFNDTERSAMSRLRIMAALPREDGYHLRLYAEDEIQARRFGILSRHEAIDAFARGEVDLLVLNEPAAELGDGQPLGRSQERLWIAWVYRRAMPDS